MKQEDDEDGPVIVTEEELNALGLPSGFGKGSSTPQKAKEEKPQQQQQTRKELEEYIQEFRNLSSHPKPPPQQQRNEEKSEAEEKEEEAAESKEEIKQENEEELISLPITEEIVLIGHEKPVSALAWESSGARLFSGSHDYQVKLWDFGGMDLRLQSFRSFEPSEGCPITQLSLSPVISDGLFAVATGSAQPKVYSRDAFEVAVFAKGDQYLSDMTNTKGHVQEVTSIQWNPSDNTMILSASLDGTVRLWDVSTVTKQQKTVIKAKIKTPRARASISSACFNHIGSMFAASISVEGTIQFWKTNGPFYRPDIILEKAHHPNSDTSCIRFFKDGNGFISRGGDDTLKLWDLRNVREPVNIWDGLPSNFPNTDCILSPDEEFILTGTSAGSKAGGSLLFIQRDTLSIAKELKFSSGVIRLIWNEKLNQIAVGLSDGNIHVLFDREKSEKGALLCYSRPMPKHDSTVPELEPHVFVPLEQDDFCRRELPIQKQLKKIKRQEMREKMKRNPSRNPSLPPAQIGTGGRLGSNVTQFLLRETGVINPEVEEDPREALLKLDAKTKKNPFWFRQYNETQPNPQWTLDEQQQQHATSSLNPPPQKKQEH